METSKAGRRFGWIVRGVAVLLALIGLALVAGGAQLVLLDGSFYYLLAGLAVVASAVLLWIGNPYAGAVYAAMLAGTLVWSFAEVGWSSWELLPRVLAPAVLGLVWFLPDIGGRASREEGGRQKRPLAWSWTGGFIVAIAAGMMIHASRPVRADPLYQNGQRVWTASDEALAARKSGIDETGEWTAYGNDPGGSRYSPLAQITPANVSKLVEVWRVDLGPPPKGWLGGMQATPLKVGDTLYTCTDANDIFALDAENGKIRWRFAAGVDMAGRNYGHCRGVAYYRQPGATGPCAERIITNTIDARLIAVDAATGRKCPDFGQAGETSLLEGLGRVDRGYYYVSSAPTIVRGRIVLGGWVMDGQYWGEPSGVIRAYDAVTGQFAWAFDMGRPGEHGEPGAGETYTPSTPNSWAPMSADEELGLVFAPTGNSVPDYYGAQRRPFDDALSSSVVALDVETGALRWSYQTMHHDLWDYDVASQPTLVDLPEQGGGIRKALVQPTKRGEIFLLDRLTGKPLARVEERRVPQNGAPGERIAPTQPFNVEMPSFAGVRLRESDMWGITPLDQLWCRVRFRQARYDGPATPPGLAPSINFPGYMGGMNWGSVAVDRARGIMFVNTSLMGNYNVLLPRREADQRGIRPIGQGAAGDVGGTVAQANTPFAAAIAPFISPLGVPCTRPPFGLVAAVDLNTRKLLWVKPFGTARDSGPFGLTTGLPITLGVPNTGGAVTTRSGLTFIGATQERNFRAFDTRTGEELWSARLPAGGQATPMSYWSPASRRQFVAISAGGSAVIASRTGMYLVAYALPEGVR